MMALVDFLFPGCQGSGLPGIQVAIDPGCQGSKLPGIRVARDPGCQVPRVTGLLGGYEV